jgi:hypothetical protein
MEELQSEMFSREGWKFQSTLLDELPWNRPQPAPLGIKSLASSCKGLLASGKLPELAKANLMTVGEQTIEQIDQVTRLVMNELLAKPSQQSSAPTATAACPKCGRSMVEAVQGTVLLRHRIDRFSRTLG